jgi:tetratricopeptide (TPR) repeat protein
MNTKALAEADRVASPRPHLGKSAQMILAVVAGIAFIRNPGLSQNLPTGALELVVTGPIDPTGAEYMAELENLRSHNKYRSTEFQQDGTFRFGMIPNGDYRLIVFDGKSGILLDQIVTVTPLDPVLMVRLSKQEAVQGPLSATVSASELRHPVTEKALRARMASHKLFDAGDVGGAARELNKAIHLSPDYAEAYSDLAALHIRTGLYEQAIRETSRSLQLGRPNARDLCNKALA